MVTENTQSTLQVSDNKLDTLRTSTKRRKTFRFILLSSIIVLFSLIIVLISAPGRRIKDINENYTLQENKIKLTEYDDELFDLKKEEAFLQSRFKMDEKDSMNLIISLPDSLMALEINGVIIYSTKILSANISPLFNLLNQEVTVNYFSGPFIVDSHYATFAKEKIIIKKAPKDTIEAKQAINEADTIKPRYVAFYCWLDKDLLINLRQYEKSKFLPNLNYSIKYNYQRSLHQIKQVLRMHLPKYVPWINLYIDSKDAIAIYRALPEKAMISIRI